MHITIIITTNLQFLTEQQHYVHYIQHQMTFITKIYYVYKLVYITVEHPKMFSQDLCSDCR